MTTLVYTGTRSPSPGTDFDVVHLPMLERIALPLPAGLDAQVAQASQVVFYSRNSAEAVLEVLGSDPFKSTSVWAVGRKTADYLQERLGTSVQHPSRETFIGLLDELRASVGPHDRIISFELEGTDHRLADQTFEASVRSISTYSTVATHWDDLDGLLRKISPRWVVFSSPRGFLTFRKNLHHRLAGDSYRIAAIGPTTAKAIEDDGSRVDHVAEVPDVDKLLSELSKL